MTNIGAPQGEITCLFTDIEGSTTLSKTLPDAEYQRLIGEHDSLLNAAFEETGVTPVDNPGDGFFVTFPHATTALRCAVLIQEKLAGARDRLQVQEKDEKPRYLQVRIGIYTAMREVFQTSDGKYVSREINLGARIGACGVGGQIIVSERTRELGSSYSEDQWKAHPNRYIRDFDTPQTLYELLWDGRTDRPEPGSRWIPKFLLREANRFIGRVEDLQAVVQWLKGDRPLMLLHGQGGVGKTRLAAQALLAVGSHYRGRIYGVALDREFIGKPEEVAPLQLAHRIALAVDAPAEVQNSEKPDTVIEYLEWHFASEPFLLVLDNYESANNNATRSFLTELTRRVLQIRCLVTCRVLFLLGSRSQSLEIVGMKVPEKSSDNLEAFEGYQLFCDRALQHQPVPDLSDTASLVRILRYTGGNALGIELTAARCVDYKLKRIAEGLGQSLLKWQSTHTEVGDDSGDVPRHASLEACIDWSFQLLTAEDQQLYLRLGIFPTDFDVSAATVIAEVSEEHLIRWDRMHLLERSRETERALLLPVLREFASLRLPEAERQPLQDQFIAYYADLAETNDNLNSASQRALLCAEIRNLHAVVKILCTRSSLMQPDGRTLIVLGGALWRIPLGGRLENLLQAIACYQQALKVYTQADFPMEWAATQNNLGNAYSDLPSGDRAQNLLQAIACYQQALKVRTEQDFPRDWAATQNNLGIAYRNLPSGDRAQNLLQAIACYQQALKVYTQANFPMEWAMTQNNLGTAYSSLPSGDRAQNLLQAIACYQQALKVYTQDDFPMEWAMTQNNLGTAYSDLPSGDRAQNLLQAIACYQQALKVYTQDDFPMEWAMTQNNLGTAYSDLPSGDRAQNLLQAIACYQQALKVRTEQDFPMEWAMTQNNLGNAYRNLPSGDRAQNLLQAIACYQQALKVRTEQDFPREWADTQFNLALAYEESGNRSAARVAMEQAITGYRHVGMLAEVQEGEDWLREHP